jgi:excisionase family DNA binding protein
MAADAERAEQVAAWEKAKAQKSGLALVPVTEKVEGMAKEPMPRRIPQLERLHKQEQTPVYITHPHLPLSERILLYKRALSPQQVADEVGVHRITIYKWIKASTIPFRPAGRHLKSDQGPLSEWAKLREILPADQLQND